MTQMRSGDGGELTGKPELPVDVDTGPKAPAAATAKASRTTEGSPATAGASQRDAADHVVVLWDEVKAPETAETKPLTKDLPDDPAAH